VNENNENNVNQIFNTGNDSQPQQPFPQSGMSQSGIPQSGYPQSGYPQSGYPQSGYPQSGYPQPGMPYPMTGYAEEKKSKTWQIVIIAIVAVLIVALTTTLIVVLRNKPNIPAQNVMQQPPQGMMDVTPGSVLLNGQTVTFDVIQKEGKTYLPVEDFSKAINYDCVVDDDKIKIIAPSEISTLEIDSTDVKIEDQTTGSTTSVAITTEPFKNGDTVYIYARDIALFLKNAYVTYNSQMQIVEINVGMGGMGSAPQGAPMTQGGQPQPGAQQGGQPQMGGQPPQN
jgi:hypothetical protein